MTRSARSPRATRLALAAAALLALAVPLVALASASRSSGPSADPSFTRDVAPIVREKCTGCHRLGGIAPFPLETARQISKRSSLIAAAVGGRIMPPWPPGPRSPAYVGQSERTLSAAERSTVLA